jgi:hypothetical protein
MVAPLLAFYPVLPRRWREQKGCFARHGQQIENPQSCRKFKTKEAVVQ